MELFRKLFRGVCTLEYLGELPCALGLGLVHVPFGYAQLHEARGGLV